MTHKLSAKTRLVIGLIPLVFVLLIVAATNFNPANAKNATGWTATPDASAEYAKYCNRCHGPDGTAKTAKGKQTRATDLTKSRIGNAAGIKVIANGKELMPGFKDNLSADEIQLVMNYVRGFRK